jgi:hypothetical protein
MENSNEYKKLIAGLEVLGCITIVNHPAEFVVFSLWGNDNTCIYYNKEDDNWIEENGDTVDTLSLLYWISEKKGIVEISQELSKDWGMINT